MSSSSENAKYYKTWLENQTPEYIAEQRKLSKIKSRLKRKAITDKILVLQDGELVTGTESEKNNFRSTSKIGKLKALFYRQFFEKNKRYAKLKYDETLKIITKFKIEHEIFYYDNMIEIRINQLKPVKKCNFLKELFKKIDVICNDYQKLKED